jgi:ankyrin repeat protein
MTAVIKGDLISTKMLLQAGANTTLKDKSGHTALHIALFEVENHLVAEILMTDAAALNSVDDDGRTALMIAVVKGDLTSIQKLLEAGVDTTLKDKVEFQCSSKCSSKTVLVDNHQLLILFNRVVILLSILPSLKSRTSLLLKFSCLMLQH